MRSNSPLLAPNLGTNKERRIISVDTSSAARESTHRNPLVSPLPKSGQLLADLKAQKEKFGEGPSSAHPVTGTSPSLGLRGGRFIKVSLNLNIWGMINLLLLFHPFSHKAVNKIKMIPEIWNLLAAWKKLISSLTMVQHSCSCAAYYMCNANSKTWRESHLIPLLLPCDSYRETSSLGICGTKCRMDMYTHRGWAQPRIPWIKGWM